MARVRVLVPGLLIDTAAVTAGGPDPDPGDDHAQAVARILPAPLTISKRASSSRVRAGAVVAFAVRVANHSRNAVRHLSVCDRLPPGLSYLSGGTRHGTEVCWRTGSLAARRARTFVVRARAAASRGRLVTNLATVGAPGVATRTARATILIIRPAPTFTG